MIEFTANKVKLTVQYAAMVYDLQSFYSIVELICPMYIPPLTTVVKRGKSEEKFIVLASIYQETNYKMVMISKEQFEFLSIRTNPYHKTATVKTVLSDLGVANSLNKDSNTIEWVLPSLGFKQLIQTLNKLTQIPNGGAPRFYLDFDGTLKCVDLKLAYNSSPIKIKGVVKSDIADIEWCLGVPGSLTMLTSSVDDLSSEDIILNDKLPWAKTIVNNTTDTAYNQSKIAYNNEFNYLYYSSRKIGIDRLLSPTLAFGQHIKINEKVDGVIGALTIPMRLNKESVVVSAQVLCPISLEQK